MKLKLQKGDMDQLEEENQKPVLTPPIETKNKFKNTDQMEIEMDSMATMKKPRQPKQKAQVPIVQAGRIYMNTKMNSERPGSTFKLSPVKFNAVPSALRTKSPMGIDKQSNAQGLTKFLQRSYSIESMDSNTDRIVASFYLESITNNYET